MPKALGWLGVTIGAVGLASVVPPVQGATVAFGLLEIAWLGGLLVTTGTSAAPRRAAPPVDDRDMSASEELR